MADIIDLDALPVTPNYRDPIKEKEGTGIGDYARSAAAGAYGTVGSLAAGADYLLDTDEGSTLKGIRSFADEGAKYQISQMSEGAREALNAGFLPGGEKSIWEPDVSIANSLGLKLANAAPSLVASILPGGLAASAARAALARGGVAAASAGATAVGVGTGTAGGVNATMMAGQVFDDIEKGILDAKEDDLRQGSEMYASLRDQGYSDTVARKVLVEAAAGNKPLIAGAIGALAEQFGAGAMVARGAAGVAEAGIKKGIKKGFAEEGITEAGQNAFQEGATQQGLKEAGTQENFDWRKILEQTTQGGVIGGIMGGAVGGVTGARAGRRDSGIASAVEVEPVVEAAARNLTEPAAPEAPSDRVKSGLASVDQDLATAKGGINGDVEAAITANNPQVPVAEAPVAPPVQAPVEQAPVTQPSNDSDFVAENEFEADPDFDPTAVPEAPVQAQPAPEVPQEPTEVAPGQPSAPAELPAQPKNQAPAVAPSEATQTAPAETIDLDAYPTPPREQTPELLRVLDERDAEAAKPKIMTSDTTPDETGPFFHYEDGAGGIQATVRGDNLRLGIAAVSPSRQGKGLGTALYEEALSYAERKGLTVTSDVSVSPDAQRVYEGLRKRGYEVTKSPTAIQDEDGTLNSKEPVYVVRPKSRVLPTQAAPEKQAPGVQKASGRLTQAEAARIAAGEGDPVTLSHNPEDWRGENDKRAVTRLVDAFKKRADETGSAMPAWAASILETRGKLNGGGPRAKAMREQYAAARQELSDGVLSKVNEGVARRETKDEAEKRVLADKRRGDATKVAQILAEVPLSDRAAKGIPAAVREHAQLVLDVAKKFKIEAPVGTQDPHLLYLRNAAEVARPGSPRELAMQFITDDFFLRNNAGEELGARRRAEAAKSEQSYDEIERSGPELREGTDRSEEYDAVGATPDVATTSFEETEDGYIDLTPKVVEPAGRTDGPDEGPSVLAGADRAGKFQTETRGRRRLAERKAVTQPSKPAAPTEAQKEAGNYRMGHKNVAGLDISIETAKGATRSGTDPSGREWSVKMPADYGYIKGTKGVDGDHVDVYLGPDVQKYRWKQSGEVFVVNQQNLDGTFDEHKVMLGYSNQNDAIKAYKAGFSDRKGGQRIQSIASMTQEEFKAWLAKPIKGPAQDMMQRMSQTPAARERAASEEIEAFFDQSTAQDSFDPNDGVNRVVSPRSGVGVQPISTQPLKDLLRKVDHTQVGGVAAQTAPFFARRLRDMVGDVPVHIVSTTDIKALVADLAGKNGFPQAVLGYYEPSTHEIILDQGALTDDAAASHLLLHEGMHAAFLQVLNTSKPARQLVESAMNSVRAAKPQEASRYYGMTNVHEFISEAFSSRSFQDFLTSIPAPSIYRGLRLNNVWQMFVSGVRRFLRLGTDTDTMLDASLRIGASLVDLRTAMANQPSTPRAMAPAPMAANIQETIRDGLTDRGGATKGAVTRGVMRVRTLDQLRQQFQGMFPDNEGGSHLDRIVRNLQRMQPFVADKREAGERFAEAFVNLSRKDPKSAQASAVLRIDVTMAQANLLPGNPTEAAVKAANKHLFGSDPDKSDIAEAWQSKSQVMDLQRRFNALPGAVQQQMLDEAAYYREMQNAISAKLVRNIIDNFAPDITEAQRLEITAKTLSGTLNEEDAKTLNNATFFNALKGARELKSIKGMYFPLMRHGNFVVRTKDKVADTMGGKEVEPGIVEFRAGKDKEARKAAEAFSKKTDLTVIRVVKKYFDPVTGEAIKAVDANAQSTVAYQVRVQTEGVHFFDTRTQAERFTREARRDGVHEKVSDWQEKQNIEQRGDLTSSQLAALVNSIRMRDDIPEAQRQMMATAIGQAAVRLMSGNRIQQKSLPRKRVQGASAEYGRNALSYATAASGYLGKLEYMPRIRESMNEMRKQANDRYGPDAQTKYHLFQEMQARVDSNDAGINQPSGFVRDLFAVTMLSKLFSPAHSLINATQPVMVSFPVLAGKHGQTAAGMELARAFNDVGALGSYRQGVGNTGRAIAGINSVGLDTTDVVASIRRKLASKTDGAALGRVLDDMRERGALDDKAQFELAASVAAGRGVAGTALAKMDRVFRQAPAAVEAVNRTVTAVAAYRLARRKGMAEEAARDYAFDTVMNTQGDYSPVNASPLFNKPFLRPFLQFKKYGQMMTNLYVDMIYRSFKGASVEERRVALKQFGTLIATQTLMAGAMSVPGLELAKAGFVLAGMLGLSDGWEEQDRKIKRLANDALGEGWSELVRKGVLSRAVGVDLSSRLSLADMWTFGEPKKYKSAEITAWIAEQYFGASGGTLQSMREGIVHAQDGDVLKATQKIVPVKAFADIAKGVSGYMEDSLGAGEAVLQGIGLKPARVANRQERQSERIDASAKMKDERNRLRSKFINAGSSGERLKIRAEVIRYNQTATPGNKLSIPSMERMREENRKERMK